MTESTRDDLAAIGLLDEPVRRRLYDWVVGQPEPVGREAAARAVGVSRAIATFHLDKLAEAGLLDSSYRRLTGRSGPGAGRPARVYLRASREFSVSLPERRYARAADLFAAALHAVEAPVDHEQSIAVQSILPHRRPPRAQAPLPNFLVLNAQRPVATAHAGVRPG